jgi:CMP-N,N'-diacetyllegionaminic acid synthase
MILVHVCAVAGTNPESVFPELVAAGYLLHMSIERRTLEVLVLIPARAGSKSVPHKNIRAFHGKPLMAHAIEQARGARTVTRVIVSTDAEAYAGIAREHGAETPFLRPAEHATDHATDLQVFHHALQWLAEQEGYRPDLCVHLRPTYPNRRSSDVDGAVEVLAAHPEWDSVRSVAPAPETPFKMWWRQPDDTLSPIISCPGVAEAHSQPRQILPVAYLQNACVDVVRPRTVLELNSMSGRTVGGYVMDHHHDIDTSAQLEAAAAAFPGREELPSGKTFVVDIDGVIASLTPGNDYNLAQPLTDNITRVCRLHAAGNSVILFTARGSKTGIDWRELTQRQMMEWGVSYDELRLGKPAADYYVDDRMLSLGDLSRMTDPV